MAFLDRLTKGVSKAAEQAKFEADKLMRVNKLSSEVNDLTRKVEQATASIGKKVIELHAAGALQVPELDTMIDEVQALEAQVAAKKAELEAAKAAKFEETALAGAGEAVATPKHCPNCGAAIDPGVKFCPSCGQKLG